MENIDVTTDFFDEVHLLTYVDFEIGLGLHHTMSELKNTIEQSILLTKDLDLPDLGKSLKADLEKKLSVLNHNINIINRVIERVHIKPFFKFGDLDICMN